MTQNRFLLRVLAFMAVLALLVFCVWKTVTWTRDDLCSHPEATTLVLGNSRVQYGFDDRLVPETWNSAVNADNYNVIYWRLRMLHLRNPQLQRVMVICDQTQVFNYFKNIPDKIHPYYWDVMTPEDWLGLLAHDSGALLNPLHYLKVIIPLKSLVSSISYNELGIGGYTRLVRDKLDEDESLRDESNQRRTIPQIHEYNVSYLRKIVAYCDVNNLELIFFNMPSYPTKSIVDGNKSLHIYVENNYPNVPFMDYELLQLPDSCFGDVNHLNYRGARVISERIAKDLSIHSN
ncbi:MAG: hypothetical protein MJZ41_00345 [Bacteroidaceae bacterium]|nr:hypothetical protein [Bacteroidaceae bacterium]